MNAESQPKGYSEGWNGVARGLGGEVDSQGRNVCSAVTLGLMQGCGALCDCTRMQPGVPECSVGRGVNQPHPGCRK